MIQKERMELLNDKQFRNEKYVIYWMQQSQRTEYNHALEYAIFQSNKYEKPLIVYFGLTEIFPDANIRHYKFMIEGLIEVENSLRNHNIKFLLKQISPEKGAIELSKDACMIIVDKGYLKIQKDWRNKVSKKIHCPFIQIESDVVVPVEVASEKEEYSAATLRYKIKDKLDKYLIPLKREKYKQSYVEKELGSVDIAEISKEKIDKSVKKVENFIGGTNQAIKYLNLFLKEKIDNYPVNGNDPNLEFVSNLSPYLHFGQISSLKVALSVLEQKSPGQEAFLEELINRRELSINFVYYNPNYDSFNCLPDWAKKNFEKA